MRKFTNSQAASILAVILASPVSAAAPLLAGDAQRIVDLSAAMTAASPALEVQATGSQYDRLGARSVAVQVRGKARVTEKDGDIRFVTSELLLKSQAAGAVKPAKMAGHAGETELRFDETYSLDVDPHGAVAASAIALCNGRSGSRADAQILNLKAPVLWRVTTGRFHFSYIGYDHVAPSDNVRADPNFYRDLESKDVERTITFNVACAAAQDAVAAAPAIAEKPAKIAKAGKSDDRNPAPKAVLPDVKTAMVTPAPATVSQLSPRPAVAAAQTSKTQCRGGIERVLASDPQTAICLCPGNMHRVDDGAGTITCERRTAQR